jgi:arginyl-tRNA--protein-N-Asp/Glu arginylyltransferase
MDLDLSVKEQQLIKDLDNYFQDFATDCPYGLPHKAVYRMARFSAIPEQIMATLLAGGFRRYGNTVYTMRCENCRSCVPIRLDPDAFNANRSQKRAARCNSDLRIESGPLEPGEKDIALLQEFFDTRYPGKNNTAQDYYAGFFLNSSGFSMALRYYLDNKLLGVSILDGGENWLNAVYFFFDPAAAKRSPGTFNILTLINLCKTEDINKLYLGYWIKESGAMSYKSSFHPHYLLKENGWEMVK